MGGLEQVRLPKAKENGLAGFIGERRLKSTSVSRGELAGPNSNLNLDQSSGFRCAVVQHLTPHSTAPHSTAAPHTFYFCCARRKTPEMTTVGGTSQGHGGNSSSAAHAAGGKDFHELVSECEDVIRSFDPLKTTVDSHAEDKLGKITEETNADTIFVQQVFYGCIRYQRALKVFLSSFYFKNSGTTLRTDYTLYMIFTYLALFRLKEMGWSNFRHLILGDDPAKMDVFLSFLFSKQNLDKWMRDEWCAIFDYDYVDKQLIGVRRVRVEVGRGTGAVLLRLLCAIASLLMIDSRFCLSVSVPLCLFLVPFFGFFPLSSFLFPLSSFVSFRFVSFRFVSFRSFVSSFLPCSLVRLPTPQPQGVLVFERRANDLCTELKDKAYGLAAEEAKKKEGMKVTASGKTLTRPKSPNISAPKPRTVPKPMKIPQGYKAKPVPHKMLARTSLAKIEAEAKARREKLHRETHAKYAREQKEFNLHETKSSLDRWVWGFGRYSAS